jgi:diadenylate cyclase
MGEDARIVHLQLNDLLSGVERTMRLVLQDYVRPLRVGAVDRGLTTIGQVGPSGLDDAVALGRELGFPVLDDPVDARGHRVLSQVGRLPDSVREDIVRYFGSVTKLLRASEDQLTVVEGVGGTRAAQLRAFFDRLIHTAQEWEGFD